MAGNRKKLVGAKKLNKKTLKAEMDKKIVGRSKLPLRMC
jgi:hypothetical protein